MPLLNVYQRQRIVCLYYSHNLSVTKGRYKVLKSLAANENIHASELTFRRIINFWIENERLINKPS